MSALKIQVLVDNRDSWIIPYANELVSELREMGNNASLIHEHSEVIEGDILCLLACEKIFKNLDLNSHNLIVHESDLPKGKGWSPVTWQVLEGKSKIPVSLFEAAEAVDAGPVYAKEYMELEGTELLPDIKHKQGLATQKLILDFVNNYPDVQGEEQVGEESFYSRRKPKDSKLDIRKSIEEQFDLLRVCDYDRYPAWFEIRGRKFKLVIEAID